MTTANEDLPNSSKVSKAQTEVWAWKEKASEELNKLSKKERIASLKKYQKAYMEYFNKKGKDKHQNEKQLYDLIYKAISECRIIKFYYESEGGNYWRKVEPYLMAIKDNGNTFVTGYEYPSEERVKNKRNNGQGSIFLQKSI